MDYLYWNATPLARKQSGGSAVLCRRLDSSSRYVDNDFLSLCRVSCTGLEAHDAARADGATSLPHRVQSGAKMLATTDSLDQKDVQRMDTF
jgi:hypothetical protein